jgi:hypothetical protein
MRWKRHVARNGEKRNAYKILILKPAGKRKLRRVGVDARKTIRIVLQKTRWEGMD